MYDQLHLNSCSANALAAAVRFDEIKAGREGLPDPSRLFLYYNERVLASVVDHDAPVPLRDGYRHATRQFIFRNSWGSAWGDQGYGYLPYAFFASPALTWDFWTMRRVS